jgi:hypothetical protein
MKLLTIFSAILFICFCTSTSFANIYSWVDENGITHFTNYSRPPGSKMVVKDISISHRTVPEKETGEEDLLGEGTEIKSDLEEDKIQAKRKKAEALEEEPYSSESGYPNVSGSDESKNSYVSEYPPGFHNRPYYPELHLIKHHPNYHYRYHLDKPYAKKHHSVFRQKRPYSKPTIWDRNPRFRQKGHAGFHHNRVFGWQPPKANGRPSAHYFAYGGGHYRGTSVSAKGRFGVRGTAFGGNGRFGGGRRGR